MSVLNSSLPEIQLCIADEATFWPWLRWPEFARWPDKESTVVVIPIAGFADHGLGCGLDAEEVVLMTVLKETSLRRTPDLKLLVVPPVRFTLGPKADCAFAIDPDIACGLLEEVASWVADSGFTRILFFNASPWSEELTKAVGRDFRIARKLRIFCVQLSALGLDFNPVRGGDRTRLKAVLSLLKDDSDSPAAGQGRTVLAETSARLASMLAEMRDLAPLANGGVLAVKTWP